VTPAQRIAKVLWEHRDEVNEQTLDSYAKCLEAAERLVPTPIPNYSAAVRAGHNGRHCNCPPEYSRCRWAVAVDRATGDHSLGHGGWGW